MADSETREQLLALARDAIVAAAHGRTIPPTPLGGELARPAGAFVSVYCSGELRGCIGHIEADTALGEVVLHMAVAAARQDPRFAPICPDDLDALAIEISVLTPLEPVASINEIVIGRDGLLVEEGRRRGLLLPQVAIEHGWDVETFAAYTCRKAGLPPDAWRKGASLFRFSAEVFGTHERAWT